jgi:hypothetical protein
VASRTHQLINNVVPDGTYELYDLEHDPDEAHDLFVRGAGGEQARLMAALGAWQDAIALPRDFAARVAGNLSTTQLPSETTLGADLGGMLAIDGVTLPRKELRAGDAAEVDLVLHAPARVPAGWRLFTHARNLANPAQFINLDHEPVEGFVPLAKIRAGQWVRDRVRFTVPAGWSGPIAVDVGLWKGAERAPAKGARAGDLGADGDHVRAALIRIQR